jgi:hypothetical protein
MKATAEDWKWLAVLLHAQDNPQEHERLLRLARGCTERVEALEADIEREPLSFIELDNDRWNLGHDPNPLVAPENVKHGFWILAFSLSHPGEDVSVGPFAIPGDGSTTETLASYISRARGFIVTHRPELEPHLRAIKFCRESETVRYTPPPSAPPLRFA